MFSAGSLVAVVVMLSSLGAAGPAAAGPIGYDATHTQTVEAGHSLSGVSCVHGTTTCVAADDQGDARYATDVSATGAATWSAWGGPGVSPGYAVECPATTLCLLAAGTINGGGRMYRSTALGGTFLASFSPSFGVNAVSCPSVSFCASAQGNGNMRFSSAPSGSSSWTIGSVGGGDLLDVSCLSSSFCVEVDDHGNVHVATEELTEDLEWTSTNVDGLTPLRGVVCTATTACLAVDGGDDVLALTIAADGQATVARRAVGGANGLVAIDCTGATCAAADAHGGIFASTDTGANWVQRYGGGDAYTSVSCASASLCAAVTTTGAITTLDPASTVPPLVMTSGALPPGAVDAPYDADVVAAGGGVPPYAWSATGLPPGLVIDPASGRISGTPMTAVCVAAPCPQPAATYTPTVAVTDGHGTQASSPLTLALAARRSAVKAGVSGGGAGQVDSSPAGISGCGTPAGVCEASYDDGTVVTLTAQPAAGSAFAGWSGGCSGVGPCLVTAGTGATPVARFEPLPPAALPAPPSPPAGPWPATLPPAPVRARLQIEQLRAQPVRARCAHRRACTKVAVTAAGTIAAQARGTITIKLGARVHGRPRSVTRRVAIRDGRWRLRIVLTGVDHGRTATVSVGARFAGSTGVTGAAVTRRARIR